MSLVHKDQYINKIFCEVTEEIYDIGDVTMPLHLKLKEWHLQMARATELCVLAEDKEMEMISKSKIIFPIQSYLFKLDQNNRLSVQEVTSLRLTVTSICDSFWSRTRCTMRHISQTYWSWRKNFILCCGRGRGGVSIPSDDRAPPAISTCIAVMADC